MTDSSELAPIAVFAYIRPQHLARLLESLAQNPESGQSSVYVFSDGAKGTGDEAHVRETREVVRRFTGLPMLELVERPQNLGLAASIIDGVTRLVREHGRVIVLEDDLVLSRTFLAYMNAALEHYKDESRVFHVSGYMAPLDLETQADAIFLPYINSHGWGTWARAWNAFDASASGAAELLAKRAARKKFDLDGTYTFSRMLQAHLAKKNNSWAIRWYLSVFRQNGLALYPRVSLTENRGFGDFATHTVGPIPLHASASAHDVLLQNFPPVEVDEQSFARLRQLYRRDMTVFKRGFRKVLGMLDLWRSRWRLG
jgi:hypothetical protein